MTEESIATVLGRLADERKRTWDASALEAAASRRAHAVAWSASHPAVDPGTRIEPFSVVEVDAGPLTLAELADGGLAVLLFFRFAGCAVCNLVLPRYAASLAPRLAALDVPLVAVSPQPVRDLVTIKRTHDLPFFVACDADNRLARQLGITFQPEAPPEGTDLTELPHPTFVILDSAGTVRWIEVRPDWMSWVEAEYVEAAVRAALAT